MTGVERAEQAVTEARDRLIGFALAALPNEPGFAKAKALADTLVKAAREVERQIHLHQPILRTCAIPACFKQYDSVNDGRIRPEWSPTGWKMVRLSAASHFCPVHVPLLDEHMPKWAERQNDRSCLACQCGWASPEAFWHGYAIAGWQDHLAQAAALIHPDTQETL